MNKLTWATMKYINYYEISATQCSEDSKTSPRMGTELSVMNEALSEMDLKRWEDGNRLR